jgi:mono/diheme cytochrome c family protein
MRLPTLLFLVCAAATGSAYLQAARPVQSATADAPAAGDVDPRAVLKRYCVTCHNERLKTAGLVLETTDPAARPDTWEKVIGKLRLGTMPPAGLPRPDRATYDKLATWLETEIDRAAAVRPDPGRTEAVHRLNRVEYRNAVRDLLSLDVDVTSLLPADDADQHGFDNIADVLSVSPSLLERYLLAARKIARIATGRPPSATVSEAYDVPLLRNQDDRVSEDLPFGSRGGVAIRHYFPVPGEYSVKVRLVRTYVDCIKGWGEPHELEVRLNGALVKRFTVGGADVGKPSPSSFCGNLFGDAEWEFYVREGDSDLTVPLTVGAGTHTVAVTFAREMWEPEGILQPRVPTFTLAIDEMPDGRPAVDRVVITGPLQDNPAPDRLSASRLYTCLPTSAADEARCARQILSAVARRAYRRPLTTADVETVLGFYEAGRARDGFAAGIQAGLERVLVAPDFLFRFETEPKQTPAGAAYRITDLELASRLSFFLWSSIPDDALLDLAARSKLRSPQELDRQIARLLADPRSDSLVENFVGQWLELRNIGNVSPDPELFQDFDENLREAFKTETELFFASQLRRDRSVTESLTADYTFVNERLAKHYGIPNVYGSRFREVAVPAGPRRAGFLSHGSLLTVTSYPNRTSPVLRGKWVLNNLLGAPPPPPPPDIPGLPESGEGGKPATVRERLERHRQNALCATCHSQMDPLGFALENFDAIGRWRTHDAGAAVDATGALPGGAPFDGPAGLRDLLLSHQQEYVATVTEKLLAYALGRAVTPRDRPAIRQIVREARSQDYRWSAIIGGIVDSVPFQMRRAGG